EYSQAATQVYSGPDLDTFYGQVTEELAIKGSGNLLGTTYLYAGSANGSPAEWTLTQRLTLTDATAMWSTIDAGLAAYTIEGWFGGYGIGPTPGDYGRLR